MYFDRDAQTDQGRVLIKYRNATNVTISKGTPAAIDLSDINAYGVNVAAGSSAIYSGSVLGLFAGVAIEDVLSGTYGWFVVAGYCDFANVAPHTVNATSIGDVLGMVLNQTYLQRIAADDGRPAFARSLEAFGAGVATAAARKIWIGPFSC